MDELVLMMVYRHYYDKIHSSNHFMTRHDG